MKIPNRLALASKLNRIQQLTPNPDPNLAKVTRILNTANIVQGYFGNRINFEESLKVAEILESTGRGR